MQKNKQGQLTEHYYKTKITRIIHFNMCLQLYYYYSDNYVLIFNSNRIQNNISMYEVTCYSKSVLLL